MQVLSTWGAVNESHHPNNGPAGLFSVDRGHEELGICSRFGRRLAFASTGSPLSAFRLLAEICSARQVLEKEVFSYIWIQTSTTERGAESGTGCQVRPSDPSSSSDAICFYNGRQLHC